MATSGGSLFHICRLILAIFLLLASASASTFASNNDNLEVPKDFAEENTPVESSSPCTELLRGESSFRPSERVLRRATRDLNPISGKGYTVINLSPFLAPLMQKARELARQLPRESEVRYRHNDQLELIRHRESFAEGSQEGETSSDNHRVHDDEYWISRGLPPDLMNEIRDLSKAASQEIDQLLKSILSEEEASVIELDLVQIRFLRNTLKFYDDPTDRPLAFHRDGGYLAAILSLTGKGTLYTEDEDYFEVDSQEINLSDVKSLKNGQVLYFTANSRGSSEGYSEFGYEMSPTLHATPPTARPRVLIVLRWVRRD